MTQGGGDLTRCGDEELRAIAYGRADDEGSRMRADAAARILTSRSAAATGTAAAGDDGRGGGEGDEGGHADGDGDRAGAIDGDAAHPHRWWARRGVVAAAVVGALVLGGTLGAGAGAITDAIQPNSLTVFERDEQPDEVTALSLSFGFGSGEARRLGEVDGVRVYGVRTLEGLFLPSGNLGTQVCVIANSDDGIQFLSTNCVPESVFAAHGISGVLTGVDFETSFSPSVSRVLAFQWGPRGSARLDDITGDVVTPQSLRYSEQDLLNGVDIEIVQTIRETPPNSELTPQLPETLYGPLDLGPVGDEQIEGVGMFASIAPADDDASSVDEVALCLSAVLDDTVIAHACRPMTAFRTRGVRVTVDHDAGRIAVTLQTSGMLYLEMLE